MSDISNNAVTSATESVQVMKERAEGLTASPDFNYTYMQAAPGFFTIFKRSWKDPFNMFPVVQLSFGNIVPFMEPVEAVKKLCELYAAEEHKYNKEKNKEEC